MTTDAMATPAPSGNLLSRAVGVIMSPRATFEGVAARPRVLGALVLVILVGVGLFGGFLVSDRGRQAFFDSMYDRIQQSGATGDALTRQEQGVQSLEKLAGEHLPIFVALFSGSQLITVPLAAVVIGGILFVIFNAILGGTATFKQVMAVVVHSWIILALSQLITLPLNYVRGTVSSATNIGVMLPMVEETSFLGRFLGSIDLFVIWAFVVLAIGLSVLYRRKTGSIAITLFGLYAVVALVIAYFRSR